MIFKLLEGIVERRMSPKSIEGPIRIAQMSGEAAREGPADFTGLMAAVSLNLAIFQPAADSDSGRRRDPDAVGRNAACAAIWT